MKKILFILNKRNTFGGVWNVNVLLADGFLNKDYDVYFLALRDYDENKAPKCDERIKYTVINPSKKWEITRGSSIISELKKLHVIKAFTTFINYLKDQKELKKDYKKCQEEILKINPDYIIASHYEQLFGIPDNYLKKTIHLQHSPFSYVKQIKNNFKVLYKFRDKLGKLVWLSKNTSDEAISSGLTNSTYIYNAVRIKSSKTSDVVNNKKLVTIARFSPEKRIDLMIQIVDDVLKENPDWQCELYGLGELSDKSYEIINNNDRISLMGVTDDPKKVYLSASINLNTSISEGLPLSTLEANECGVPTVTFNTGESVTEVVLNEKSGYIIKKNDIDDYKNKLDTLMKDKNLLQSLAKGAKANSKLFQMDVIINKWISVFKEIQKK